MKTYTAEDITKIKNEYNILVSAIEKVIYACMDAGYKELLGVPRYWQNISVYSFYSEKYFCGTRLSVEICSDTVNGREENSVSIPIEWIESKKPLPLIKKHFEDMKIEQEDRKKRLQKEYASKAEAAERAEYERLKNKFGSEGVA